MKQKTPRARLSVAQAAQVFQMLADGSRLRILLLLAEEEELSVSDLRAAIQQSQPATSRHLTLLRATGLVSCRRLGRYTLYSLRSEVVRRVLESIGDIHVPPTDGSRPGRRSR
jgi:DNA-binding transcriptional ArsR family regulator